MLRIGHFVNNIFMSMLEFKIIEFYELVVILQNILLQIQCFDLLRLPLGCHHHPGYELVLFLLQTIENWIYDSLNIRGYMDQSIPSVLLGVYILVLGRDMNLLIGTSNEADLIGSRLILQEVWLTHEVSLNLSYQLTYNPTIYCSCACDYLQITSG